MILVEATNKREAERLSYFGPSFLLMATSGTTNHVLQLIHLLIGNHYQFIELFSLRNSKAVARFVHNDPRVCKIVSQ